MCWTTLRRLSGSLQSVRQLKKITSFIQAWIGAHVLAYVRIEAESLNLVNLSFIGEMVNGILVIANEKFPQNHIVSKKLIDKLLKVTKARGV